MPPLERMLLTLIVPSPLILPLGVLFYAKQAGNKWHCRLY